MANDPLTSDRSTGSNPLKLLLLHALSALFVIAATVAVLGANGQDVQSAWPYFAALFVGGFAAVCVWLAFQAEARSKIIDREALDLQLRLQKTNIAAGGDSGRES